MIEFAESYIGCLIAWIINYIIGRQLFEHTKKDNIFKVSLLIIIFTLLLTVVNEFYIELLHGVVKVIISYILICIFYKLLFKMEMSYTLVTSLILYLIMFASEIIIAVSMIPILYFLGKESLEFLEHTLIINILNASLSYIVFKIGKNKILGLIKNNKFNNIGSITIILLLLITIALLFFRIPISRWNFNSEFIITMIILFCSCVLGIFLVKQKADIQRTASMYQQLARYSDITNGLLEDYRVVAHEHKNQLLIVRSMIEEENEEVLDYLDNLLDKRTAIKYVWIGQLNHLPLSGLKGLINYKLIEMEKVKININISISSEISKTKLEKLSTKQKDELYSIMGVYLDNAIQAAIESKEKEVSLEIYKEKKDIVIILANTYKNDIDLGKMDDYGYTTKGKNHGVGLHIVKKILNEESVFSQSRNLFQEYYVQELRIHLDEIKQKKKKH